MSTSAQQIANRANAQSSTGPITPAGKARSAMNSRVHGLCAKEILIGQEEKLDFDRMSANYGIELHPNGDIEQTLFDEIIAAAWQLRRVQRMQTEACSAKADFTAIIDDEELQKKLERLSRHHTRLERTFHRCLKELNKLQGERQKQEDAEAHDLQLLRRYRKAHPIPIAERTQSAGATPPYLPSTSQEFAGTGPDLDSIALETVHELRKTGRDAA